MAIAQSIDLGMQEPSCFEVFKLRASFEEGEESKVGGECTCLLHLAMEGKSLGPFL